MKLYLSSNKIGNRADEIKKWIASNSNRIIIITNAKDYVPDLERTERVDKVVLNDIAELESVGFEVERLDLRDYFGKKEELEKIFTRIKAFYVIGGNTFGLRKAMNLSGFDELLIKYANEPEYFYGGYSAGSCVLSKDIRGVALLDNPDIDPYNSGLGAIYNGIGLIEDTIIPHFETNPKYAKTANSAVRFCKENGITYRTLRDGDVIIKDMQKEIDIDTER